MSKVRQETDAFRHGEAVRRHTGWPDSKQKTQYVSNPNNLLAMVVQRRGIWVVASFSGDR